MPRPESWLTNDEKLQVALLFREGKTNKEISNAVVRSMRQVVRYRKQYKDVLAQEAQDKLKAEHVDSLMKPFRFPEDIGDGDHLVPDNRTEYALDAYDFYLTNYGVKPMLGLVKHYARIAASRPNMTGPDNLPQAALFAEMYWYADLVELVGGDPRPDTEWITFNIIARSTRWPDKEYLSSEEKAEKQGLKRFVMPADNAAYFKYMPMHNEVWQDYSQKQATKKETEA